MVRKMAQAIYNKLSSLYHYFQTHKNLSFENH